MAERPSKYQLRAALRVARLIDVSGNTVRDAHGTYRYALTQGEHPAGQLEVGEQILTRIGLLLKVENRLVPAEALHALASVDEETALDMLARETGSAGDDQPLEADPAARIRIGALGEEHITELC